MARSLRIDFPGAFYHVLSRGNRQEEIFIDDSDRTNFLNRLSVLHQKYGILVHAYVLMDNHYHLLAEAVDGNISRIMRDLNGGYTVYFNKRHQKVGHLFQGRYKSLLVDKDSYLLELSKYIHLNPVRARRVKFPKEYPWSSYGYYTKKDVKRPPWLQTKDILQMISHERNKAYRAYRRYVEGSMDMDDPAKGKVIGGSILGGGEFLQQIKPYIEMWESEKEISKIKQILRGPKIEKIIEIVAHNLGCDKESLSKKGGKRKQGRQIAIYLARKYTNKTLKEIGGYFGISYPGIASAVFRMEEARKSNKQMNTIIAKIENTLLNKKT